MVLVDAGLDLVEAETRAGCRRCARLGGRERERAHGRGDRRHAQRALEQVAAVEPRGDDVADGRIVGRIAPDVLGFLKGACPREYVPHGNLLRRWRNLARLRLFQLPPFHDSAATRSVEDFRPPLAVRDISARAPLQQAPCLEAASMRVDLPSCGSRRTRTAETPRRRAHPDRKSTTLFELLRVRTKLWLSA